MYTIYQNCIEYAIFWNKKGRTRKLNEDLKWPFI